MQILDRKGVLTVRPLPDTDYDDLFERIVVAREVKERLHAQAALSLTLRGRVPAGALPIHGLIVLSGPPGTGKTSLARGLASKAARSLRGRVSFLEAEPHALTSSALGKSQREVRAFFQETVAEHAAHGPLIVLLDEVETLAASRARLSLEANPVDVHRATDAVLASLDALAAEHPGLLFIATTNFEGAVDEALLSRADLVEHIGRPDRAACVAILRDALEALADAHPGVRVVLDDPAFEGVAGGAVGLDGRQIRKAVVRALTFSPRTALNPDQLSLEELDRALKATAPAAGATSDPTGEAAP